MSEIKQGNQVAAVRGQHGGWRPGSGRKVTPLVERQATLRELFHEVVTPDDWRVCIEVLLADAKGGNIAAFRELAPWMVGSPPPPPPTTIDGQVAIKAYIAVDVSRV